ncbi:MAG: hypothetical protein ACI4XM_00570 [Candidatus Coprovivens sp.]
MIAKKGLNEQQIAKLYESFCKKYKKIYTKDEWDYIEENFWTYIFSPGAPDLLMQIYTELGIESINGNFYQRHLNNLKTKFDIRCNILDVASGIIPSFANLLAHEQLKIGKGTVTIYEPLLGITKPKYKNMTLHKDDFTSKTHIKEFDLVTAILPCSATETIIESACRNQKDFYIAMCGCTHFDYIPWGMYVTPEMYQDYVINKTKRLLEDYNNGTLVVERLEGEQELDYPILYTRKK